MFYIISLIVGLFAFSGTSYGTCEADVYLKNWRGGFKTVESAFDYCFENGVRAWGLDEKDWRKRYCRVSTQYDYEGKFRSFSVLFSHKAKRYKAKYASSIFDSVHFDFRERVYDGYRKNIEIRFPKWCGDGY